MPVAIWLALVIHLAVTRAIPGAITLRRLLVVPTAIVLVMLVMLVVAAIPAGWTTMVNNLRHGIHWLRTVVHRRRLVINRCRLHINRLGLHINRPRLAVHRVSVVGPHQNSG